MTDRDLWYGTSGPKDAKIVLIGESWGQEELTQRRPFVGTSGTELTRILARAGISRDDILLTNMIAEKPDGNETWRFFLPKSSTSKLHQPIGRLLPSDLVSTEIRRLYSQLAAYPRSLVIASGNWSLWSVSRVTGTETIRESNGRKVPPDLQTFGPTGITTWRGSMLYCDGYKEFGDLPPYQLLPIIHPAAIMRQWSYREPTIHDLKTRVPLALKDDWRPPYTEVCAPPTFEKTLQVLRGFLASATNLGPAGKFLACDLETLQRKFISCIGFAPSDHQAIAIPLIREVFPDGAVTSYWSPDQEAQIVALVRAVLTHPNIRLIGQHFIYDTQYLQHWLGVTPRLHHDTMLGQNVLFPGTPKDLSYLSSLYCHYHWHWKEDYKDWQKLGDLNKLLEYNCIDTMRTYEIGINQLELIGSLEQQDQMQLKMDTHHLCLRMMNRGVRYDTTRRGPTLSELMNIQLELQHELLDIIPQNMVKPHKTKKDAFWYNSSKQTAELFYDHLGFDQVTNRKTGNRTVGKEALPILQRKYPEFTALFSRLDRLGSLDNVINVINMKTEHDGRVRCSYNPGGTETHRLSSSENVFGRGTNLQNLTKGEEDE